VRAVSRWAPHLLAGAPLATLLLVSGPIASAHPFGDPQTAEISQAGDTVRVHWQPGGLDTYSPFLNDFGATEFDTEQRYNGLEDNMVLPADLTSRITSFQTDAVALYAPVQVVGEATVPSGEVAAITWDELKPGTTYAWLVTARSAGGGVTSSEPSMFVTRPRG
jgi:hypothetical protein